MEERPARTQRPDRPRVAAPPGGDAGSSVVRDGLIMAMSTGTLPAGTKLPEDAIGRVFVVSRTVVREALRELASVGLVTLIPNRGAFVATADAQEARDIFAARRVIEHDIVADVAANCTPNDIRRLRRHLADQQAAMARGDRGAYIQLLGEFHNLLAGMGRNAILAQLLRQLVPRTTLLTTLFGGGSLPPCALHEHAAVVDALEARDPARAAAVMHDHLTLRSQALDLAAEKPEPTDFVAALAPYAPDARRPAPRMERS